MTTKTYSLLDFFNDVFDDMDGVFKSTHSPIYPSTFPPCNVWMNEDSKDIEMEFAVAGIPKDKIKLSVDGDYLLFNLEKVDNEKKGFKIIQQGIKAAEIKRSFYIPASKYDMDGIRTELRDGILTIKIPAKEKIKKKLLEIR